MAISRISVDSGRVQVYDENGSPTCNFSAPAQDATLERFDENRIYLRHGAYIFEYDERGGCISTRPA